MFITLVDGFQFVCVPKKPLEYLVIFGWKEMFRVFEYLTSVGFGVRFTQAKTAFPRVNQNRPVFNEHAFNSYLDYSEFGSLTYRTLLL